MKLTILPEDGMVSIDGLGFTGFDLSFMSPNIHAIQWYGEYGEIELKDVTTGKILRNDPIDSIAPYQQAIDQWNVKKVQHDIFMSNMLTPEQLQALRNQEPKP